VTPTAAGTGNNSILRSIAFIIGILISYLAISNGQSYIRTTSFSGPLFAGNIFEKSNMLFDRLLLRQWAFGETHLGPLDVPEKERKKRSRLDFGNEVVNGLRGTGTAWAVKNVPRFREGEPGYVPNWGMFVA
jgi:hypothetical protein